MVAARWPDALSPSSVAFWNETPATFGPPSVGGPRQVVASDAGKWRAAYEIEIHNPTRMLLARATIHGIMQGPLTPLRCGPFDCHHDPLALSGVADPGGAAVLASMNMAAALRDTTIMVQAFFGMILQAGQYIGIDNRLYLIATAEDASTGGGGGATLYELTIWPPLRAAVAALAEVELRDPVCPMRIVGDVPRIMRDMLRFGHETIELEETINA